jgi:hypothetical protein
LGYLSPFFPEEPDYFSNSCQMVPFLAVAHTIRGLSRKLIQVAVHLLKGLPKQPDGFLTNLFKGEHGSIQRKGAPTKVKLGRGTRLLL